MLYFAFAWLSHLLLLVSSRAIALTLHVLLLVSNCCSSSPFFFFLCDHAALYATTDFFTGDAALYTSDVGEDEGCAVPFEDEVGCAALPGRDEGCPAPSEAEGQRAAGCAAPLDGVGACCCGGVADVVGKIAGPGI